MDASPIPEGDPTPDRTFAAVGHALTCWETLELELAVSYTIFIGKPRIIEAMTEYGSVNRKFSERMAAVLEAADSFFIAQPSQDLEGAISFFVASAIELSIARHRIAHGMLTAIPVLDPAKADENGWVGLSGPEYRIGAPWYATKSLRTNFIGIGSKGIDAFAEQFSQLRHDVAAYNMYLSPPPSPILHFTPLFQISLPQEE